MSETLEGLFYAPSHEWLKISEDGTGTVGITDFAQSELGDIVFVELPEVGKGVSARDEVSVVESVKTASDIHAPVSGEIVAVNDALNDTPEIINTDSYDAGWIFKIALSNKSELESLLSSVEYTESCDVD